MNRCCHHENHSPNQPTTISHRITTCIIALSLLPYSDEMPQVGVCRWYVVCLDNAKRKRKPTWVYKLLDHKQSDGLAHTVCTAAAHKPHARGWCCATQCYCCSTSSANTALRRWQDSSATPMQPCLSHAVYLHTASPSSIAPQTWHGKMDCPCCGRMCGSHGRL